MDQKMADAAEIGDAIPMFVTCIASEFHSLPKGGELVVMAVIISNVSPIGSTFEVKVEVTLGTSVSMVVSTTLGTYITLSHRRRP